MMKKFLIQIVLFFLLLFIIDRTLGYGIIYMTKNTKGGYIGHHNYITDSINEEVLIFGSSRAIHHYNPQIISDSLNLTCYNCGQDGNGILLDYGWWQIIKEHHKPKIIIYDVTASFDLLVNEDNHKYLGWLKGLYDRANINDIFDDIDKTEKYKMTCQMYRYNSKFLQIAADYIHPLYVVKANGFLPLEGEIDTMRIKKNDKIDSPIKEPNFDPLKIQYLNKFIDEIGDVKIVFTISPTWYGLSQKISAPIREICLQKNIPFLDFSNDPKYVHNNNYFKDGSHLNAKGADEFTRDLIKALKLK